MASRMTREEALASLAEYRRKHPNMTHMRKAYAALGDDTTLSRFVKEKGERKPRKARAGQRWLLNLRHRALELGQSLFQKKVKSVDQVTNVLVSGHANAKIGRDVRKGKLFRGYWIYTLTLEERATCPRSCQHWEDCYGNNMPWANRVKHGHELIRQLRHEIKTLLSIRGRAGILIRLHALGDFYDVGYVRFWEEMLAEHPRLAVYGYTALAPSSATGWQIMETKRRFGSRFAIRWSGGPYERDCTVNIDREEDKPHWAFVCPEQTGKTAACATCGLCWNTDRNVAFLTH